MIPLRSLAPGEVVNVSSLTSTTNFDGGGVPTVNRILSSAMSRASEPTTASDATYVPGCRCPGSAATRITVGVLPLVGVICSQLEGSIGPLNTANRAPRIADVIFISWLGVGKP